MMAAFQGRCPTCGHDSSRDADEFRRWFESRVHLEEDGCEIGVGVAPAAALRQSPTVEEVAREAERIRRIIQTRLHLHPTDETLGCLDRAVLEIVNGAAALYERGGG